MLNNNMVINCDIYEWNEQLCFLSRIHVLVVICIDSEVVVLLTLNFMLLFVYIQNEVGEGILCRVVFNPWKYWRCPL